MPAKGNTMSSRQDEVFTSSDHASDSPRPKTNGARRIYEILILANGYSPAAGRPPSTLGMWGTVLGGDILAVPEGPTSGEYEDAVLPLLTDLRLQIRSVGLTLRSHPDYKALIEPLIAGATNLTNIQFLNGAWNDVKGQHFKPTLTSGWGLLAPWMPATDDVLTAEQLKELIAAIRELEEAVQAGEIPDALRIFVLRQVTALRAAVMRHRISGTQELRRALALGYGELSRDIGPLTSASQTELEKTKSVLRAFGNVWTVCARFCGDLDDYIKAVKLGYQIYNTVNNGLPLLQVIVSSVGS